MSLPNEFLSLDALYFAYRKSKADLFFEKSQPVATKFADYEENLAENLLALREKLTSASPDWFVDAKFIGDAVFVPKKLEISEPDSCRSQLTASDPYDTWANATRGREPGAIKAEFRAVADFTVDMHIVNALWINLIGYKFDACLDKSATGSRVRRIASNGDDSGAKNFHLHVWQTFEPYYRSYSSWRANGLKSIRQELKNGNNVVAVTMDLRSFYHNIDGDFLLDDRFLEVSQYRTVNGGLPTDVDREFTSQLLSAFATWANLVPGRDSNSPVGVPVGAMASKIIANVILLEFDKIVKERLAPIYYGRYVDDVFLVLRDTGQFKNGDAVISHIATRIPELEGLTSDGLTLHFAYAARSRLVFQQEKQRVFLIKDDDILDSIESKIEEVSSEWRLLPDLADLEKSPAARVLTAARRADDEADSLRKADNLSLRRLGFALLLRSIEAVMRDLPPREWKAQRNRFYDFAIRHVVTPIRIFDLFNYVPRLLAIAVSCRDWPHARRIVVRLANSIEAIREVAEVADSNDQQWNGFYRYMRLMLEEAIAQSIPFWDKARNLKQLSKIWEAITALSPSINDFFLGDYSGAELTEIAQRLFCKDLASRPFKDLLLRDLKAPIPEPSYDMSHIPDGFVERRDSIGQFLEDCNVQSSSAAKPSYVMPLLFPTRPLRPEEVTDCVPQCAWDLRKWKRYVNALRGTWYQEDDDIPVEKPPGRIVVGSSEKDVRPRLAITSWLTDEKSWNCAAHGKPDLSQSRYGRLVAICNAIVRTSRENRPTHVIFPELSIPHKWMRSIAEHFLRSRISLIAGAEYRRHRTKKAVVSEAFLYLTDNRLGYPSWCVIRQQKGKPAPHERIDLRSRFGLSLAPDSPDLAEKRIYRHFGFEFGTLICSELTDINFRRRFRGRLDCLFVLSWNRDLESFAALVDATVLDVHCFLALVNNRVYGDSRIRAPYKDSWRRDIVRVKGGQADYFVVAEIDYHSLREFQSHRESPDGPFKPVPEGFEMSRQRKQIPGVQIE